MNEEIQFQVVLNFKGKPVLCKIFVRDEKAISFFTKREIGRLIYEEEKKVGNNNIFYDNIQDAIIEKFPKRSKEEILKLLKEQLKSAGGREL